MTDNSSTIDRIVPVIGDLTDIVALPHVTFNHTQLWRANWRHDNRVTPVVIKQLRHPAPDWQRTQFCQEIHTLQHCQSLAVTDQTSIGITRIFSVNLSGDMPYFIMPYYTGHDLTSVIAQQTASLIHRIKLMIQLCYLLDALHSMGYLHGDVTPNNLRITMSQQLLLLDFGLSRPIDLSIQDLNNRSAKIIPSILTTARIASATTAGTPAYMSPEQFTGQTLTQKTDYYSLGVILFEILTGQKPFIASNLHGWAVAHCQQPIPLLPITKALSHLPHQQQTLLQAIIDTLLSKYPTGRTMSLSEVAHQLDNLITI